MFYLFYSKEFYSACGIHDLHGVFDTLEDAEEAWKKIFVEKIKTSCESYVPTAHIANDKFEIVRQFTEEEQDLWLV